MKRTRKLLMLLCAVLLAAQLSLGAAAAGPTYTLTLNNTGATQHTFEIYQVFTGDLAVVGGQRVLSNIVWGSGVTSAGQTAMGNAKTKAETITTEALARAFANELVAGGYLTGAVTQVVADENMVIAGHSYRTHFGRLQDLLPDDSVIYTSVSGESFAYRVDCVEVLSPWQTEEMTSGDWDLTLFTCTWSGSARLAIRCTADTRM